MAIPDIDPESFFKQYSLEELKNTANFQTTPKKIDVEYLKQILKDSGSKPSSKLRMDGMPMGSPLFPGAPGYGAAPTTSDLVLARWHANLNQKKLQSSKISAAPKLFNSRGELQAWANFGPDELENYKNLLKEYVDAPGVDEKDLRYLKDFVLPDMESRLTSLRAPGGPAPEVVPQLFPPTSGQQPGATPPKLISSGTVSGTAEVVSQTAPVVNDAASVTTAYDKALNTVGKGSSPFISPEGRFIRQMHSDIMSIGSPLGAGLGYEPSPSLNPEYATSRNKVLANIYDQINDPSDTRSPLQIFKSNIDNLDLPDQVKATLSERADIRMSGILGGLEDEVIDDSLPKYPTITESEFQSRFKGVKFPDSPAASTAPPTSGTSPKPGKNAGNVSTSTSSRTKGASAGARPSAAAPPPTPPAPPRATISAGASSSTGAPSKGFFKKLGKDLSDEVVKSKNLKLLGLGAVLGVGGLAAHGMEKRRTVNDNIQRRLEMQRNNYY